MKNTVTIAVLFCLQSVFSQIETKTFAQINSLFKTNPKPVVVFIHTDWCKICKIMENSTLKNKGVIKKLNANYYFVSLNAEEKNTIIFNNLAFKHQPNGVNTGVNQLAEQLGTINGELAYPTICVLNKKHEIVFQYNKLLHSKEFIQILNTLSPSI